MINLLKEMNNKRYELMNKGVYKFEDELIEEYTKRYLDIASRAIKTYELNNPDIKKKYISDYIKVFKRMIEYIDNHLLFINDFNVPFTNNISERSLRIAKTKKKVSGQSSNIKTANDYAIALTIIESANKQGNNILNTIHTILDK